jgi:tetratricopeptide (TPR) repeat protein
MNISGFEKIAPYLTHPLVLVGFVLLLAYGIHWQLMRSGLLRQVSQKDSGLIIRLFLRYGFWLALVLLLAGFGLQFSGIGLSAWNKWMEKETAVAEKEKVVAVNAGKMAEKLYAQLDTKDQQLADQAEQIKSLTEAITALSKADAPVKDINAALRALEQGDTKEAEAIFTQVAATNEAVGQQHNKKAAEAYRHLGALAFQNDTKASLTAYRKSVKLDPDHEDGWNHLGILLGRTGEIVQAEEAFRKVLALAEAQQDNKWQAKAISNLGILYRTRGDLDRAEEMFRKGLELNQALGRKEGMAINYANLGNVHQTRGELDRAEEMYQKSLEISKALGLKDASTKLKKASAKLYGNLGALYERRADLDKAETAWRKSLSLFQEIGHPNARMIQLWLDELAEKRASSTQ